ncbi:NADH-quinone oxidoreductase subunit NuoN [Candidatus Persebacteraceae bacterium Df01]|jgi:NADH-quinone oxidoreductase subunit N|uniref:NADH-quinone oxidoreductase subunit N n=1 Tax=Candidatus Doriopsillibacter californiensis TaxID=2970740 RepID=A0ABT7QLQ3_9GAMM|nr:NADH-quinone oxidoreductase subunit NuoN [Candidatus Persebacteraceae bacterium Df01]
MKASDLIISAASVEIFIFIAACSILCADLFLPKERRARLHWAAVAGLLIAAAATAGDFSSPPQSAMNGFFVASPFTALLKTTILLAAAGSLAFSRHYLQSTGMLRGEFHCLSLLAVLGMLVMVSAGHFLSLYMGLELMSLCLYALIAMRRNSVMASEAAIKYFVLGALASGLFLYGVSIIYGTTGQLYIRDVAEAIVSGHFASQMALTLGLVFMLAGLAFKLGAAPFHMWLPDVYQGAPAPVTLFIAAAPKVAAMAMLLRVLVESLGALSGDWRDMLIVLAVASLAVGNLTAIAQTNFKRMLAYSAIAHSGFMLLGVLAGGIGGVAAAMFYIIAYALMTVGGFGVLVLMSADGEEKSELADIKGLASRNGLAAGVLLLLMFSMAGIPPVVGFAAKLAVLEAAAHAGLIWLVVLAVLFSVVGAFYYLRVVKLMFFDKPEVDAATVSLTPAASVLLALIGVLVLFLGLFPGGLLALCEAAAWTSL